MIEGYLVQYLLKFDIFIYIYIMKYPLQSRSPSKDLASESRSK